MNCYFKIFLIKAGKIGNGKKKRTKGKTEQDLREVKLEWKF